MSHEPGGSQLEPSPHGARHGAVVEPKLQALSGAGRNHRAFRSGRLRRGGDAREVLNGGVVLEVLQAVPDPGARFLTGRGSPRAGLTVAVAPRARNADRVEILALQRRHVDQVVPSFFAIDKGGARQLLAAKQGLDLRNLGRGDLVVAGVVAHFFQRLADCGPTQVLALVRPPARNVDLVGHGDHGHDPVVPHENENGMFVVQNLTVLYRVLDVLEVAHTRLELLKRHLGYDGVVLIIILILYSIFDMLYF